MGIRFNVDEIFAMAEQIEKNGAVYYTAAAKKFDDPKIKKLLQGLADMENSHLVIFHALRSELKDPDKKPITFDPDSQSGAYLKAMAEGRVFNITQDPEKMMQGTERLDQVFETAIGFEKDSIAFYMGLKELIPENIGHDKIDKIIKEEMNHISILNEAWAGLKA